MIDVFQFARRQARGIGFTSAAAAMLCLFISCSPDSARKSPSPASPPSPGQVAQAMKPEVVDAPLALGGGRSSAEFVPDKLFGFDDMPGGNTGSFVSEGGLRYQRFAITHRTESGATITLATLVRRLSRLNTIHGYEGFRGPIAGKNCWMFRSGKVVAGVMGLPDDEAKIEMARMAYSLR
ncbi:MAG: hypothetical protein U5J83_18800 [Bryobacterales bacterium]|nr:hypothetical protein [Bryobacterales bacterium]